MDFSDLGIPNDLENFDPEEFERELAAANGQLSSSESESEDSVSEDPSESKKEEVQEEVPELTEEQIIAARQERYGRRRSHSIDYGGHSNNIRDYEQTPEQALYTRSLQLLKTIPRLQYEALSWVPDLLKVQDSQQEINAEEWEDLNGHDLLPDEEEIEKKEREKDKEEKDRENEKVQGEMRYRVGILGDVGVGKTTLLHLFLNKTELTTIHATNGVDYEIQSRIRDNIRHRYVFCDFSGQERLRPIVKGYLQSLNAAIIVLDASYMKTLEVLSFSQLKDFYLPELRSIFPSTFPLAIVMNKCDLPHEMKKSQISKIVKPFFANATICSTGRGKSRFTVNSVFRDVMDQLRQGDKHEKHR